MLVPGDPWFGGQAIRSNGLAECLDIVERESRWREPVAAPTPDAPPGQRLRRGRGIALSAHISGLLASGAIVRLLEDGSVLLNTGAVDIGQGSNTVLTQICAEALQLPVDRVAIASPDTDGSPYNWGTTASRVTYVTGRSVVGAAAEIEKKLKEHAGEMLECGVDDLELLPGGKVAIKGVAQKAVSFADISGRAHWAAGGPLIGTHSWVFDQKTFDPKRAVALGLPFAQIGVFSFNALVVEVELDEATGQVRVVGAWSACDVGRAINPMLASGQIEGAFVQGMGYALVEEMVWDGARLANPSLMDYKIPTMGELPETLRAYLVESDEPSGPFGAKSVGELGINGVAAAIANAVADAAGIRLRQLPMTGERVLRALLESGARVMKPADYPPQEPLSALGTAYHDRAIARGAGIEGSEFAYGDDPYQQLTVYPAASGAGDVLVFFHGGGWTSGYKEWMAFMAPALQARGVTFVSAGYRLAPGHLFPTGFDDAADAVAWVHRHAAEHGADPARIFVGGHSAGGHYAALLAATADWRRAAACRSTSSAAACRSRASYRLRRARAACRCDRVSSARRAKATPRPTASPLLRLDAASARPSCIAWGGRDFPHLATQAREMHDALRAAGIAAEAFVFEGCDHFEASLACGQPESGWPDRAAAWMRAIPTPNH